MSEPRHNDRREMGNPVDDLPPEDDFREVDVHHKEETTTGWGDGRPEPKRPYGTSDTPASVSVGRVTNIPNTAMVEFQVESPEGVEHGFFPINLVAPFQIRRIPSRTHITLVVMSRREEISVIRATREGGSELHGLLWRELADLRLQLIEEQDRRPPQRRLAQGGQRRPSRRQALPPSSGAESGRRPDRQAPAERQRPEPRAKPADAPPATPVVGSGRQDVMMKWMMGLVILVLLMVIVTGAMAFLASGNKGDTMSATAQSSIPVATAPVPASHQAPPLVAEETVPDEVSEPAETPDEPWSPK